MARIPVNLGGGDPDHLMSLALRLPLTKRLTRDDFTPEELARLPHDDYRMQLNFTIWLLCGLAAGFMGLRIYCKYSRHRGLWWDDYVLLLSWMSLALAASMTSVTVSYGYGRHLYDIDPENLPKMTDIANVAGCLSILAALWSKTSFALTLLRISDGWLRKLVWFIIISMIMVMGASAILVWVPLDIDKVIVIFIVTTSYSGAMDIILAFLPWKIIWSLVISRKEKFGVAFAMSMGVFAGATSLVKVFKVEGLHSTDPVDSVQLVIFGAAESAITIIAASIPILRALIRDSTPKMPQFYHLDQWHEDDAKSNSGARGLGANLSIRSTLTSISQIGKAV